MVRSEAVGRAISAVDAFIAVTAETHDLTLVVRNDTDFEPSLNRNREPVGLWALMAPVPFSGLR